MSNLIWSEKYSCGIRDLDEQNKILIALINKTLNIVAEKNRFSEFERVYGTILIRAKEQFEFEEEILKRRNIGLLAIHKNQHIEFLNRLIMLRKDYMRDENVFFDFQRYIQKWIDGHICLSDQRLGKTLEKN